MQEGAVGTPLIALGSVLLANSLFRAQERYRMREKASQTGNSRSKAPPSRTEDGAPGKEKANGHPPSAKLAAKSEVKKRKYWLDREGAIHETVKAVSG